MENLLEIEKNFLTAQGVNFEKVHELRTSSDNKGKELFELELKQSKIMYETSLWFKKESTKEEMYDAGIEFTNIDDFNKRVFNYSKSQGRRKIQAGEIVVNRKQVVTKFKRHCTAKENAGETAGRGLEALIKFDNQTADGGEPKPANKTLFSMSIAKDGLNGANGVSSRVFKDGATGIARISHQSSDMDGLSEKSRNLYSQLLISISDDAQTFINNQNS